jgi:non-specific serine/threonine protein kinase
MLAHYVELTERADREWYAGNSTRWIERLRQERPNLHAAMSWALGRPDRTELGLRLAGNLRWFWRDAGEHIEGYSWLKQALARAPDMATGPLARAEIAFGNFLHSRLNFELAREMIDRGLSRLEDTSPLDSAWGLSMKAQNAALSGRQAECTEAARRALDIAGNLNSEWIAANAHLALGLSHAMDGRHSLAVQEMTGAYDRSVQAANSFLQTYVTVNLALQRLLVGDTIGSREFFVRSLRLSRELQNPRAVAGCFEGLGYLAAVEDDPRLGARLMGAAARIRDITGMPLLPQWRHPQAEHQRIIESRLGRDAAALERAAGAAVPVDDLMPLLT